ncbi:translocation protein SEC63 [Pseudohyphozyma bogoriensis]|nr:translocation protein SEC63 [Pseudohyphozyma bogoriensis]
MAGYNYDTHGNSYFFFLTVLVLFLVPFTYSVLFGGSERAASRVKYPCAGWNVKSREARKLSSAVGVTKSHVILAVGWLAFAFVVQRASGIEAEGLTYDPYQILGLARGATEKEIKRHFKVNIARKFHPDKLVLAPNQTKEDADNHFVELTKAYKSLTDDDIRHNLEMYGHPDGKQEFSQGIALPSWVVESQNVWWVMGAYALVLGVMLPFFVGKWWYGSRKRTKDGILNSTAAIFFKSLKEETTFPALLDILAASEEFAVTPSLIKARKAIGKGGVDEYARITSTVREGKQGFEGWATWSTPKKRARVLIAAHLLRIPIKDAALLRERLETVTIALTLTTGLSSIALASNWLSTFISILHLQQFLLQAVDPTSSPLLQLPHVEDDVVQAAQAAGVETVEQFGKLDQAQVEKLMGSRSGRETKEAHEVSKHWPVVKFASAKFQVVGEKIFTPGAVVSFTVKLRISPPGAEGEQPTINGVETSFEDDVEGQESSIEELIGRRNAEKDGVVPTPLAHAPHFPKNRKPTWYIFVGDHKLNRVFVPPQKFSDMGPEAVRTIRISFQAPPGPGLYTFQAYVMSDSFVGTDVQKDMRMRVEAPPAEAAPEEEDDISEPDEDSLAGQMAMMKGQPVRRIAQDSDDDTSGTEESEEEEDSSSDSDSD